MTKNSRNQPSPCSQDGEPWLRVDNEFVRLSRYLDSQSSSLKFGYTCLNLRTSVSRCYRADDSSLLPMEAKSYRCFLGDATYINLWAAGKKR